MSPTTRRGFLRRTAGGLGAFAFTGSRALPGLAEAIATEGGKKPNVIFFLGDDLGYSELGCYGNTFNETPNLDRLARQGMRFTDAYAAAPVCSPYRAALMTGQWPARIGITDYLRPNDPKHLAPGYTTIAEVFKSAGYATGMIGKWHLTGYEHDGAVEVQPTDQGFDEAIVSERRGIGGGSYWYPYHFNPAIAQRLPGKEYLVDRVNLEAVDFVERHKHEPFFLYVSHYAVHTRLVGKPDLVAKYEAKPGAGKGDLARKNNPHLAAQLEVIDEGVGMVMRKLDELGLADDTLLIFTGDNGGEDRVTSNAPLRAGKSTLYEGGIREPLLVRWPGVVPSGAVCRTPTVNCDFYPTFCAILGVRPDPTQPVDGVSILPILKDPSAQIHRDTFYWHYPLDKPHFLGGRSAGAIRQGDWKLIEFFDTGDVELYNLADDPGERNDLAGDKPEKARELLGLLEDWRRSVSAQMPARKEPTRPGAKG